MSFFASALGGTILGKFLDIGSRWFDVYAAKKQAETEVMRAKALAELKLKEEEMKAFTASQNAAGEDAIGIPSQAAPWAANIAVLVDSFRRFTRPGLTWALMAVLAVLAFYGDMGDIARDALVADLVFSAATALTWWYGSRPRVPTPAVK